MGSKWKETTIGEFCPFIYGKNLPKKTRDTSGNIPVFGSNGIIGLHSKSYVNRAGLIIGRKGTVGAITYSPKPFWPIDTTFYVTDDTHRDLRYTFYLLKSIGLEHMNEDSAVPGLNRDAAHARRILTPPLPEQKAITHILGSLDDKIELNQRMNKTLEAMAQALFKSWFVDFDPVIDNTLAAGNKIPKPLKERAEIREALGAARKPLPEEIQKLFPAEFEHTEEMGWIPKGWETKSVDSILNINPTIKLTRGKVAPYVDMKALPTSGYSVLDVLRKDYSGGTRTTFQNGDILLAKITPCLENGKTAVVDFLNGIEAGFGSTEFIILRGNDTIKTPFVACLARDSRFREHSIRSMTGSSGRQRVQTTCFTSFYLAFPEKEALLNKFHCYTEVHFSKIKVHTTQIRDLIGLRESLLPKLLSGEIRVPQVEQLMKNGL